MSITQLNILSEKYNKNPYYFIDQLDRNKRIISDHTLNAKIAICYSTVKELLSQKNIFSTKPLTTRAEPVMRGKVLAQMNGQEHKFKRSLITKKITGNILVSYYKQYLHDLCDELIHQLQLKNEFDFIVDFGKNIQCYPHSKF